jgi:hypothetical protein
MEKLGLVIDQAECHRLLPPIEARDCEPIDR